MTSEPINPRRVEPASASSEQQVHGLLPRLLASKPGRFFKFGAVGGSGVVVNLAVFRLCFLALSSTSLATDTRHTLANLAGLLVSIFTNFLLNDSWTWGDRLKGGGRDWLRRLARYYMTCGLAGAIQVGSVMLAYPVMREHLELELFGVDPIPELAVLVGIALGIAVNFPISHLWAFKDADVTDDDRQDMD